MKTVFDLWRRCQATWRVWAWPAAGTALALLAGPLVWFHLTNPYAGWNIVGQPYTTSVRDGQIVVRKNFGLRVYSGQLAQAVGYYKSGFLIAQNTLFGGQPVSGTDPDAIARKLYQQRFDPSKPYLISGDQFSVLYPRNLGIFYNNVLDPTTVVNQQDWENRQRTYLQSVLYALEAFNGQDKLTTTIVPIGPHSAVLAEVHPGSVPSDTLYGILYALNAMRTQPAASAYKLQTTSAVAGILRQRRGELQQLLRIYTSEVRDPVTGLVRRGLNLAGARDGVTRDSSFYDNVILWKTLQLADQLGVQKQPAGESDALRARIIHNYWDDREGHFRDDLSARLPAQNYSSDWLVALSTGFLSANRQPDQTYLARIVGFIRAQRIAEPFPIKYQPGASAANVPWIVSLVVPGYGANDIWSYWGSEYIGLLNSLFAATHNTSYNQEAQRDIHIYEQKMVQYHGFPETFAPDGTFLRSGIYKSILRTGWVVDFESVKAQALRERP